MGANIRHELHVSCDVCDEDHYMEVAPDTPINEALDALEDTTEWFAPILADVRERAMRGDAGDKDLLVSMHAPTDYQDDVLLCPKCAVRFGYYKAEEEEEDDDETDG